MSRRDACDTYRRPSRTLQPGRRPSPESKLKLPLDLSLEEKFQGLENKVPQSQSALICAICGQNSLFVLVALLCFAVYRLA